MSTLPTDIIHEEILPRCAARSLLRFKCVSKSFNTFLSSPEFINLHLRYCLTYNPNRILVLILKKSICCIDLDLPNSSMFSFPLRTSSLAIVGTCNGVLCMEDFDSFILINPCTGIRCDIPFREFSDEVLRQNHFEGIDCLNYGFGYDSFNDDYKVVATERCKFDENYVDNENYYDYESEDSAENEDNVAGDYTMLVFVYSFKTDNWRTVMTPWSSSDSSISWRREGKGALINNHLIHWLFWCADSKEHRICCFDLETEQWVQDVPLPDYDGNSAADDAHFADVLFETSRDRKDDLVDLGVFDKCLCLLTENQHQRDVWVMKEYGIKESWVKLMGVSDSCVTKYMKFCPLTNRGIAKDEVLVRRSDSRTSEFVWYNITNQRYQRLHGIKTDDQFRSHEVENCLDACICEESLVTLPADYQILGSKNEYVEIEKIPHVSV